MKEARIYVGVAVDGCAVMARVMIPADHNVCRRCAGSGMNYDNDEICAACNGDGTVPENPTIIEE